MVLGEKDCVEGSYDRKMLSMESDDLIILEKEGLCYATTTPV